MLRRQPSSKTFLLGSFLSTIGSRWLLLFPSYAKTLLNATGLLSRRGMAKHQMWISWSKWGLPRSCYFWESSSLAPWISLEQRSHVLLQLLLDPGPPGTCTVFLWAFAGVEAGQLSGLQICIESCVPCMIMFSWIVHFWENWPWRCSEWNRNSKGTWQRRPVFWGSVRSPCLSPLHTRATPPQY